MRFPLRKTTRRAMFTVIVTMVVTAPMLTALSIGLLPNQIKATESERFISELGIRVGGLGLKLAVVLTASSLLLFASNTAIIGSYHVFLALVKGGFLPKIIAGRNSTFNTPHIAIAIATVIPVLVILLSHGEMKVLGDMYAFGLLGAFVFSSLSLDSIRWRLGRRDPAFWIGVFTTAMVVIAWVVNLVEKQLATYFGSAVTAIGMITAIGVRRSWFVDLVVRVPFIQRLQAQAYRASEDLVEDELKGLVTLAEAVEVKPLYSSSTLLAIRDESPRLIQEGLTRAKGRGESALYCIYVEEWPGLFAGESPHCAKRGRDSNAPRGASGRTAKKYRGDPHLGGFAQRRSSDSQCCESARRRFSDHRSFPPVGVLSHAARPRRPGTNEKITAGLPLDDLQLSRDKAIDSGD